MIYKIAAGKWAERFPSSKGLVPPDEFIVPYDPIVMSVALALLPQQTFDYIYRVWEYCQHIKYKTDKEIVGAEEFFQFPNETITNGVGDCEDNANLVASLLLVVFPPENVRVVYAQCGEDFHVFAEVFTNRWIYVDGTNYAYALNSMSERPKMCSTVIMFCYYPPETKRFK
jgi:transglutaminase-like putative cysteine protease